MRALVIDDSRTVRIIIRQILSDVGMDVFEAANGMEALEQIDRNPDIGLLLVDWTMPVMNGIDFVKAVRANRAWNSMRILMVTSEAQADQVTLALNAGANEYLMKPFSKEVLLAKLNLMDVLQE